ncbi:hypothetical protein GGR57DRAFT_518134 [Xylariaceae sp. FL1272]|nr:hypothetical protein GGR57DRAFT_518134 [Xylariaceae sp. FL1272]
MSRKAPFSENTNDGPEFRIAIGEEVASRPARSWYFWGTRPSQVFIHYAAKHLRQKLAIEEVEARTLAKLRTASVLAVKQQWVQKGIWDKSWDKLLLKPALKGFAAPSDGEDEWDEWKHVNDAQSTESRPLDMFLSQIIHEVREAQSGGETDSHELPSNMCTSIYDKVKKEWITWGIWTDEWEVLPGLKWRHEGSLRAFMMETNWYRQIRSIPVPPGMGRSPEEMGMCIRPERFKKTADEVYRYQKRVFEQKRLQAGKQKLRTDWNDPDLSEIYHEWSYEE